MRRGKITEELLNKLIEARKNGLSYTEIEKQFNVSRWVTIKYLKNINVEQSVSTSLWKKAEQKADFILKKYGFKDILDLNKISPNSYFDKLCFKNNEKWLVDVTINESKDLANKTLRVVEGFRCAILYINHNLNEWRLFELRELKRGLN
jgi:hypothetical protein